MKYYPRLGLYKASNLTFNPSTLDAYSYGYWRFVARVEGVVIFNNYRYSNSTSKHQYKVRSLLKSLGIKIDIEAPFPNGISRIKSLSDLVYEAEIQLCNEFLESEINKQERAERARFRRKAKNLESYLDNIVHFNDYEIKPKSEFGFYDSIAVHQVVGDIERDVNEAINTFVNHGYSNIVFYI